MVKKIYRPVDQKQSVIDQLTAAGVSVTATNGEIYKLEFDTVVISKAAVEAIVGKSIEEFPK